MSGVGSTGGRPPVTTHDELARVALALFDRRGFDETTVDQIAGAAGVGRRTFFRYFPTKAAVLWYDFDRHVDEMRESLAGAARDVPMMSAVRDAVLLGNRYGAADLPDLRTRTSLISTVPALQASATLYYARWEAVIAEFVAVRTGLPASSLYPSVVGRCVLAACRAAYADWASAGEGALRAFLFAALGVLEPGFDEQQLRSAGRRLAAQRRARARRATRR
jgi:mycofactocin system transcriptional regulator